MLSIQKKLVVDERGQPQEVIISWEQYQQIIEMLGLDLDDAAIADLREARRDWIAEKHTPDVFQLAGERAGQPGYRFLVYR